MSNLPSPETPLNQHSLVAIESWLHGMGANKSKADPCLWVWVTPQWSAEIKLERDELKVTWEHNGQSRQRAFPYGLPRYDVQIAIAEGP